MKISEYIRINNIKNDNMKILLKGDLMMRNLINVKWTLVDHIKMTKINALLPIILLKQRSVLFKLFISS